MRNCFGGCWRVLHIYDPPAVTQAVDELAVVDRESSERRLGDACPAAVVDNLAQQRVGLHLPTQPVACPRSI